MSAAPPEVPSPVHDLVGVGFGPSNLALAIAVHEHNATTSGVPVTARFLERQAEFGWHRGMLIDDATMQVSFLKDLVTLRNPVSEFSFLSYLHSQGRLVDFVNHKCLFPLRIEFHHYFEWAAERLSGMVSYGHEVTAVRPVRSGGEVAYYEVESATGEICRGRNLVVATGLAPRLPDGVTATDRVWHNSDLLERVSQVKQDEAYRFVVVGAGQSAAEVTAFLHSRFGNAEVCSVFSRFGYSPSDDSAFANRVFDPDAVDQFYAAPEETKRRIMGYHSNTNYAVVDLELIDDLYRRLYREQVLGIRRLQIFNVSRAAEIKETPEGVQVTVESLATGEHTLLDADFVVYATGYRPGDPLTLPGGLGETCARDAQGRLVIRRDYRIATESEGGTESAEGDAGVYLQGGGTEHTHGITSSLLSNNAVRSGEILHSVLSRRPAPQPPRATQPTGRNLR